MLKYDKFKKRLINIAVDNRSSPYYALRDRHGNAIGVTACDIDGDGREEIYVLNTNNAFSGMKWFHKRGFEGNGEVNGCKFHVIVLVISCR